MVLKETSLSCTETCQPENTMPSRHYYMHGLPMRFRPIGVSSDEVLPEEETYMLLEMSHKSVQCLTYYLLVDGNPMNMEFVMA